MYENLQRKDKAVFEATEQYKKLMALHTALYPELYHIFMDIAIIGGAVYGLVF